MSSDSKYRFRSAELIDNGGDSLIKSFQESAGNRRSNELAIWRHLEKNAEYPIRIIEENQSIKLSHFKGEALSSVLKERKFGIREFFTLAISLTRNLHSLHKANVIHSELHPDHILVNLDTFEVVISDLGGAWIADHSTYISNSKWGLNELPYIAPELTGRINHSVGFRADLYSLGIIFYEIITGEPPFQGNESLELIHAHLARTPHLLHQINTAIPEAIGQLVSRLLEKNPDNRYQTVSGLQHDLEYCLDQWTKTDRIDLFELGSQDVVDKLTISSRFYGRKEELAKILDVFEEVESGRKGVVTVAGSSGIGKTALVQEMRNQFPVESMRFLQGKFDRFKKDLPYNAWIQAFSTWTDQILSGSTDDIEKWKKRIHDSLGPLTALLIEMVPTIELITGTYDRLPEVSGREAQNRFNYMLDRFLQVLTSSKTPLVIFLDDCQWSDNASQQLLERTLFETPLRGVLVFCAYQPQEVQAFHPFQKVLDTLGTGKVDELIVTQVQLEGLSVDSLNQLLADTLKSTIEETSLLSETVYEKTKGKCVFLHFSFCNVSMIEGSFSSIIQRNLGAGI